jgi:hypothetical protein
VIFLAHGIGKIQDLPVPAWLFYYGAAIVLVVSFVALGALWTKPRIATLPERPLPAGPQRVLQSRALHAVVQALSFGLLVVVFLAALVGENSAAQNLAPTFIYVVFWLGLVAVVVLLGNVWRYLNPWRAAADFVAWAWPGGWTPPFRYPERLGRWPAAVLLLAFAALELAYEDPSSPRALAIAIALYSWITWMGALAFGRDDWFANGEAFTSYFGLYSRLAPFGSRDGRLVARVPLRGLAEPIERPGTVAFVAVMLGTVLFDGFSRTTWFLNRQLQVQEPFALDSPGLATAARTALNLVGMLGAVLLVGLLFVGAVDAARRVSRYRGPLAGAFVGSLIPIALAYVVAHYFSLFVLQGQLAIRLASDPFGRGWDLFHTKTFPTVGTLAPNTVWYVQVAALIVGHVLGLVLAHDRAVALFPGKVATRAQYAMLALMVLYTVGGMWVLSSG